MRWHQTRWPLISRRQCSVLGGCLSVRCVVSCSSPNLKICGLIKAPLTACDYAQGVQTTEENKVPFSLNLGCMSFPYPGFVKTECCFSPTVKQPLVSQKCIVLNMSSSMCVCYLTFHIAWIYCWSLWNMFLFARLNEKYCRLYRFWWMTSSWLPAWRTSSRMPAFLFLRLSAESTNALASGNHLSSNCAVFGFSREMTVLFW